MRGLDRVGHVGLLLRSAVRPHVARRPSSWVWKSPAPRAGPRARRRAPCCRRSRTAPPRAHLRASLPTAAGSNSPASPTAAGPSVSATQPGASGPKKGGAVGGGGRAAWGARRCRAGRRGAERVAQHVLLAQALELEPRRQARREVDHPRVEEGEAPLHRVRHRHPVALGGEDVARQQVGRSRDTAPAPADATARSAPAAARAAPPADRSRRSRRAGRPRGRPASSRSCRSAAGGRTADRRSRSSPAPKKARR